MLVECQKIYKMELRVEMGDDDFIFNIIKENYEENATGKDQFKNVKAIDAFIREEMQPKVPFKNRGFGWRVCKVEKDRKYLLIVDFELSKKEIDFIY